MKPLYSSKILETNFGRRRRGRTKPMIDGGTTSVRARNDGHFPRAAGSVRGVGNDSVWTEDTKIPAFAISNVSRMPAIARASGRGVDGLRARKHWKTIVPVSPRRRFVGNCGRIRPSPRRFQRVVATARGWLRKLRPEGGPDNLPALLAA